MLEAAERLLKRDGYAKLTTNRVAEVAGVNVALVYRYFAGKEALVGALVERAAEQTLSAFEQTLVAQADAPLEVAIRAMVETLMSTPVAPEVHRELVEQVSVTRQRQSIEALRAGANEAFAAFLARRADVRKLDDAARFVLAHGLEAAAHAATFYRPPGVSRSRAVDALVELVHGRIAK